MTRRILVGLVLLVTGFTLTAGASEILVTCTQGVRVEAYPVRDPATLLAELMVGGGDQIVDAYVQETPREVILHVAIRRFPGSCSATGLTANGEITLQALLGDREDRAMDASPIPEASLDRMPTFGVDDVNAR